jgi:diketogulonate reductase-like aldo/keto reductase
LEKSRLQTPAQVALRWAIQRDTAVIPKSVKRERIIENGDVFGFELGDDEMEAINKLDKNWRILDLTERDGDHPHFPFKDW